MPSRCRFVSALFLICVWVPFVLGSLWLGHVGDIQQGLLGRCCEVLSVLLLRARPDTALEERLTIESVK